MSTYAPTSGTIGIDANTNRITDTGFSYDAAGNLTQAPVVFGGAVQIYAYDAENKLVNFNNGVATYAYDGDEHRVQKTMGSATTIFVYDVMGKLIAEYSNTMATGSGTKYITADNLGSTRVITDAGGNVLVRRDYLPFGEEIPSSFGSRGSVAGYGATEDTRQKFTGKERDAESGLDYFMARYDGSGLGRFLSPDPLGGHQEDPQTLNRYSYVRNNPLSRTDPTGLDFNLTCEKESDTCHNGVVGQWGKPDNNGNRSFNATVISNDKNGGLVDQYANQYNATVTAASVQISRSGSDQSSLGVFINGTNATSIQGTGSLSGFRFDFTYGSVNTGITAGGTFSYNGTAEQAEEALQESGYSHYFFDTFDFFHRSTNTYRAVDFRSPGATGTGAGSGHFTVEEPVFMVSGYRVPVRDVVPSAGTMHLGEHNPYNGGFINHMFEALKALTQ